METLWFLKSRPNHLEDSTSQATNQLFHGCPTGALSGPDESNLFVRGPDCWWPKEAFPCETKIKRMIYEGNTKLKSSWKNETNLRMTFHIQRCQLGARFKAMI